MEGRSQMNSYTVGTAVKCQMTFYSDEAQTTVADPTGITFRVRAPSGTITEYIYGTDAELVKSGTGVYYVLVTPTAGGIWKYAFEGTGAVVETKERQFLATNTIFQI